MRNETRGCMGAAGTPAHDMPQGQRYRRDMVRFLHRHDPHAPRSAIPQGHMEVPSNAQLTRRSVCGPISVFVKQPSTPTLAGRGSSAAGTPERGPRIQGYLAHKKTPPPPRIVRGPYAMAYRGTSLIRNCHPLGPCSRPVPRALRWS